MSQARHAAFLKVRYHRKVSGRWTCHEVPDENLLLIETCDRKLRFVSFRVSMQIMHLLTFPCRSGCMICCFLNDEICPQTFEAMSTLKVHSADVLRKGFNFHKVLF